MNKQNVLRILGILFAVAGVIMVLLYLTGMTTSKYVMGFGFLSIVVSNMCHLQRMNGGR